MYSACKLNKQGDSTQPWYTLFAILNQSIFPCVALIVTSWLAYNFLRRQLRWPGIPISLEFFTVCCDLYSPWCRKESDTTEQLSLHFHTVKVFSIVNEAEVDVFLELPCFLHDPVAVSNLTSGFSAFSKQCLYIWKFSPHLCRNLAWRILCVILLACEISATIW